VKIGYDNISLHNLGRGASNIDVINFSFDAILSSTKCNVNLFSATRKDKTLRIHRFKRKYNLVLPAKYAININIK
jgi:hypothetical protein